MAAAEASASAAGAYPDTAPTLLDWSIVLSPPRHLLVTLAGFACLLAAACSGGDGSARTPTSTPPTVAATATIGAASPTADALGDPDADGARIFESLRRLAVDIGPRVAGSDGDARARAYLQAQLEGYGYTVTQQSFPFDATQFLPGRVDVGTLALGGYAMRGTTFGDATGPIVVAGLGAPDEFPAGGLNGAIALIERGDLKLGEKAANAVAAGASGVIISNNASGNFIGDLGQPISVPVIGIKQTDGAALRDALAAGPTSGTLLLPPPKGTSYNVIAKPPGVTSCETITGGHFDSVTVTGGAHDNASGTAGVLEVARLAAANRLAGAHCFILFGAEELGLIGSRAYVAAMTEGDRAALKIMLNLDMIGGEADLSLIGDEDLVEVARIEAGRDDVAARSAVLRGSSSDHAAFAEAGMPVVMFNRGDDQIHTSRDTIDRMFPDQLEDAVRVVYGTLTTVGAP